MYDDPIFSDETLAAIEKQKKYGYAPYAIKRIFNGKAYNTQSANLIATYEFYPDDEPYYHCDEELYQTKKGSFFIVGTGASHTMWSKKDASIGEWRTSYSVVPLAEQEVKRWLEARS